jgi:hypothetical protein
MAVSREAHAQLRARSIFGAAAGLHSLGSHSSSVWSSYSLPTALRSTVVRFSPRFRLPARALPSASLGPSCFLALLAAAVAALIGAPPVPPPGAPGALPYAEACAEACAAKSGSYVGCATGGCAA